MAPAPFPPLMARACPRRRSSISPASRGTTSPRSRSGSPPRPNRSPALPLCGAVENLGETCSRAGIGAVGESVAVEQFRLRDLSRPAIIAIPLPAQDMKHGDVVSRKTGEIGVDAVQL